MSYDDEDMQQSQSYQDVQDSQSYQEASTYQDVQDSQSYQHVQQSQQCQDVQETVQVSQSYQDVQEPQSYQEGHSTRGVDEEQQIIQQLFTRINGVMDHLKQQLAQQETDLNFQLSKIDEMEKDSVQHSEEETRLKLENARLKEEVQQLTREMRFLHNKAKASDQVQQVNQKLRKVKEDLFNDRIYCKIQLKELLDFVWEIYSKYNTLIDELGDEMKQNNHKLYDSMIERNENIVGEMIQTIDEWTKTNSEHGAAMVLLFNQEKHRIAMKAKFAKGGKPRNTFF